MEWSATHGTLSAASQGRRRLHDCLYGEEDEGVVASSSSFTKTGYGSWSLHFRLWLRQKHQELQREDTANSMLDSSDTIVLQCILAQLSSHPDFEPNEGDHKDLLAPMEEEEETAERFICYWKEHQRFFVLKDLHSIWSRCCPVHCNLISSIIQHIDRITGNTRIALPTWMGNRSLQDESEKTCTDNSLSDKEQSKVTKVFEGYFSDSCSQANGEATSYDAEDTSHCYFSTWVSQHLPQDDGRLDSLCLQLGKEGSRGKLSLQLQRALTIHGTSPTTLSLGFPRIYNPDPDCRKGEALLKEIVRVCSDTVDSQEFLGSQKEQAELPSWTTVPSKGTSVQLTVEKFLQQPERCPNLGLLVDWLWRGAEAIADGTVDEPLRCRDDLLESIRTFSHWIPFGAFAHWYIAFVNEQLSKPTLLNVQWSQMFPEIILTWLGEDSDWWSLWWLWLEKEDQLVKRILNVYHQCAGLPLDSDELPQVRSSCAILSGLLKSLNPVASHVPRDFKPRLLEAFALFRDVELAQSRSMAKDDPIRSFCNLAGEISTISQVISSLSLKTFVESAIEFSSKSSTFKAQDWCQRVVADCCRWHVEDIGKTWINLLLGHFRDTNVMDISSESALIRNLGTLIRLVWTSYAKDVSLVEMLVDAARNFPLDAIDFLLEHCPPELLFMYADIASIANIFKDALRCFQCKSWFIVLLGLSLALEASYSEQASHYAQSRHKCLVIARSFLLDKIRTNESSQLEAAVNADRYIRKRLFDTTVALQWWEDACRDLLDRPEYKIWESMEYKSDSSDPTLVEDTSLQEPKSALKGMTSSEQELPFKPAKRPRTSSRQLDSDTGNDAVRAPGDDARQGSDDAMRSTDDFDPIDSGHGQEEEIDLNSNDDDYDESKDDILFLDL